MIAYECIFLYTSDVYLLLCYVIIIKTYFNIKIYIEIMIHIIIDDLYIIIYIVFHKQGFFSHEGAFRRQILLTCRQIKDCMPILSS